MTRPFPHYLLAAVLLTSTIGCANPAADAPDAVVEEPASSPSEEHAEGPLLLIQEECTGVSWPYSYARLDEVEE